MEWSLESVNANQAVSLSSSLVLPSLLPLFSVKALDVSIVSMVQESRSQCISSHCIWD